MATSNSKINSYASFEYKQLADFLTVEYNKSEKYWYPMGTLIQMLRHNWYSEEEIIKRLCRYQDLYPYKELMLTVSFDDLPIYINDEDAGLCWIARWRLELGR